MTDGTDDEAIADGAQRPAPILEIDATDADLWIDEHDHHVPADLIELHEVLEWQAAVEAQGDR